MYTGICSVIFMMTVQATTCKYHYHEHVIQKSIPDYVIRTSKLHCISHDTQHMILTSSCFNKKWYAMGYAKTTAHINKQYLNMCVWRFTVTASHTCITAHSECP